MVLGRPLLLEIIEKQRGTTLPPAARSYLRGWTIAWGLFFFVRTAGYVWMAYNLTLERALVIRGVLGPVSLGVMFVGEMAIRFLRFGRQAFIRGPAVAAPAEPGQSAS